MRRKSGKMKKSAETRKRQKKTVGRNILIIFFIINVSHNANIYLYSGETDIIISSDPLNNNKSTIKIIIIIKMC